MTPHNITLQSPSTSIVFTKYPSVMDSLCNHKDIATQWADQQTPSCICSKLAPFSQKSGTSLDHIVLEGETMLPPKTSPAFAIYSIRFAEQQNLSTREGDLRSPFTGHQFVDQTSWIASSSTTARYVTLGVGLEGSCCRSHQPHHPQRHQEVSLRSSPMRSFTTRTRRPHHSAFIAPATTSSASPTPSRTRRSSKPFPLFPAEIIHLTLIQLNRRYGKAYPWALGKGRELPNAYVLPKKKKDYNSGRPIVSFMNASLPSDVETALPS